MLGTALLTTVTHQTDPKKIKPGQCWHIATLIVCEHWRLKNSDRATIPHYTGEAIACLDSLLWRRELKDANGCVPVFAVRLNSGLFGVPWEQTKAELEAKDVDMTILTPRNMLAEPGSTTLEPTVEPARSPFASTPTPSPFVSGPTQYTFVSVLTPSHFASGSAPSPFASGPTPYPFVSGSTPSPFAFGPTPAPFVSRTTPSPFASGPTPPTYAYSPTGYSYPVEQAASRSIEPASFMPTAPSNAQSLHLTPMDPDAYIARLNQTTRSLMSQSQGEQEAPLNPPRGKKTARSESVANSPDVSSSNPNKRQKKMVVDSDEEWEEYFSLLDFSKPLKPLTKTLRELQQILFAELRRMDDFTLFEEESDAPFGSEEE